MVKIIEMKQNSREGNILMGYLSLNIRKHVDMKPAAETIQICFQKPKGIC